MTEIDPSNGEVLRRLDLSDELFGEGLTIIGDRVILLTWQAHTAFVYDLATFTEIGRFSYEGEGWGLCLDEDRLIMSNGTNVLTHRDPQTFEVLETVAVTYQGQPIVNLNELECVDGMVWSNIWMDDAIVIIDPDTGEVTSVIDARDLLTPAEAENADVLNGIAYDHETETWLLTGKKWPTMFEVRFDPCTDCG